MSSKSSSSLSKAPQIIKITHSYIFPHHIDNVYSVFTEFSTYNNVVFVKFINGMTIERGEKIDENDTIFSLVWKNYYKITFITKNVIKTPTMRAFTHKTTNISEITGGGFDCTYRFFWNSCEMNTLFQYEFTFTDPILSELFKDELSVEEMVFMCREVEKYIFTSVPIEQIESTMINENISKIWSSICDLENVLIFLYTNSPYKLINGGNSGTDNKKMTIGKKMSFCKEINGEDVVFAFLVIKEIVMNEQKREILIECTFKEKDTDNIKNKIPKQIINIKIKKINDKSSLIVFKHYTNEYVSQEKICELGSIKRKILINLKNMLEKNSNSSINSKNSNNNSMTSGNSFSN